jgi:hypothetical protein
MVSWRRSAAGSSNRTVCLHFNFLEEHSFCCPAASYLKAKLPFALSRTHIPFIQFMVAPFTASLYSRIQLLEHENRLQNQAISHLQGQNELLSLTISRLRANAFAIDTSDTANSNIQTHAIGASDRRYAHHHHKGRTAYDVYRTCVRPASSAPLHNQRAAAAQRPSSCHRKPRLDAKQPTTQSNSSELNNAMRLAASFNSSAAFCSSGAACRKEFCDLAHSAFFCCAHGVHCLKPEAAGVMSVFKARGLHDAHLSISRPAASAAAAADNDRFCVWIHVKCGKVQPRSNHLCRSGFGEVRVLCDARRPQSCRSWGVYRSIGCFSSFEKRANGVGACSLRGVVQRQLPSLLLEVAPDSFMFTSAAAAMEALQYMVSGAESPVSLVHIL